MDFGLNVFVDITGAKLLNVLVDFTGAKLHHNIEAKPAPTDCNRSSFVVSLSCYFIRGADTLFYTINTYTRGGITRKQIQPSQILGIVFCKTLSSGGVLQSCVEA